MGSSFRVHLIFLMGDEPQPRGNNFWCFLHFVRLIWGSPSPTQHLRWRLEHFLYLPPVVLCNIDKRIPSFLRYLVLYIQSIYVLSRFRIKQRKNHGLVCSLSCIVTTCVRNWGQPPTCGNIATYGIIWSWWRRAWRTLAAHHAFHIWMLEWEARVWFELQVHTSTSKQPTNKCDNRHQVAVRICTEN